jgi:argininosuccinate lyase
MLRLVLENMLLRPDRMRRQAECGYLNATEIADYLVGRGVTFREAHHVAGRVVRRAIELDVRLEDLALDEYRRISPLFAPDVYEVLDLKAVVSRRGERGGTSPAQVRRALERFQRRVAGKALRSSRTH